MDELIKNIEILKDCIDNAPVDFLGTGSDSRAADKEAKEWYSNSENAYKNSLSIISNLQLNNESELAKYKELDECNKCTIHNLKQTVSDLKSAMIRGDELNKGLKFEGDNINDSETPFYHEMLPELFEGIEQKKSSASFDFNYTLSEAKGEVSQISYLGKNEWRIFIDNFPMQKKFFSTNFPIVTVERFMSEMKYIGLDLKLKVK